MEVIAMLISKYLELDMFCFGEIFFNQQLTIAKAFFCFALRTFYGILYFAGRIYYAHSLPTTTSACLNQNGITNFLRLVFKPRGALLLSVIPWHRWHISRFCNFLGADFRTEFSNHLGRRSNKDDSFIFTTFRE